MHISIFLSTAWDWACVLVITSFSYHQWLEWWGNFLRFPWRKRNVVDVDVFPECYFHWLSGGILLWGLNLEFKCREHDKHWLYRFNDTSYLRSVSVLIGWCPHRNSYLTFPHIDYLPHLPGIQLIIVNFLSFSFGLFCVCHPWEQAIDW